MILFVSTGAHRYTHTNLRRRSGYDFRLLSYNQLLRLPKLPRATVIFSDFDRLSNWELELAALAFRCVEAAGARALNDPAASLQRFALLRRLFHEGINSFRVWRPEDGERPDRFPVFLRTQSAHRGPLGDLLADAGAAEAALATALAAGHPLRDLMFVEYCAEPTPEGVFRKLALYRIGDRTVATISVHERRWAAKFGEQGVAGEALYRDELELIRENRYGELLMPAFEAAGIRYGRADFGLVGGRPQVYEINTNPTMGTIATHPFPDRVASDQESWRQVDAALAAIDTPTGGAPIPLDAEPLVTQRRRDRLVLRTRWMA